MCLYPKLIANKKYTATKKNGGIIPKVKDNRILVVPVKCGKCMECVKAKAREYQIRLSEHIRKHKNGRFVTLTISNEQIKRLYNGEDTEGKKITKDLKEYEGYELDNKIATIAVRRFTERWRKEYKEAPKHWLVTELGHEGTENVHVHGIIWTDEKPQKINEIWKYGWTWGTDPKVENYVSERTIGYIIKYITKVDAQHKGYKAKVFSSKGIGSGYMERTDATNNKYKEGKTKETYTTRTGHKISLPIYWRNKIYTEEEREKLWIEKLDKQERYVLGNKISIKNGEDEYYKILKLAREKAKRLGYLDDEKNWSQEKYEKERRIMNMKRRLKE